jgi:hypothetical protein
MLPDSKKVAQKWAARTHVDVKTYPWGNLVTVSKGISYKAVLHPEHQEKILSLAEGGSTRFKDEQSYSWEASRKGDRVFLKAPGMSLDFDLAHLRGKRASYDEPPHNWVSFTIGAKARSIKIVVEAYTTLGSAIPGEVYQDRVLGPAKFEFPLEGNPMRTATKLREIASLLDMAEKKWGRDGVRIEVDIL